MICEKCYGTGKWGDYGTETCPHCHGQGHLEATPTPEAEECPTHYDAPRMDCDICLELQVPIDPAPQAQPASGEVLISRPRSFRKTTEQLHQLYVANRKGESMVMQSVEGGLYTEAAHQKALAQARTEGRREELERVKVVIGEPDLPAYTDKAEGKNDERDRILFAVEARLKELGGSDE